MLPFKKNSEQEKQVTGSWVILIDVFYWPFSQAKHVAFPHWAVSALQYGHNIQIYLIQHFECKLYISLLKSEYHRELPKEVPKGKAYIKNALFGENKLEKIVSRLTTYE